MALADAVALAGLFHPERYDADTGMNPQELVAGWAILEVASLDEAIEWSKRFRKIVGPGVSEIVQVYGPHDFPGEG